MLLKCKWFLKSSTEPICFTILCMWYIDEQKINYDGVIDVCISCKNKATYIAVCNNILHYMVHNSDYSIDTLASGMLFIKGINNNKKCSLSCIDTLISIFV